MNNKGRDTKSKPQDTKNRPRFGTLAVHAGQEPDASTGAIMTPIYQTSTFVQSGPGEHKGFEYARVSNPTRTALEGNLAALEGADHAVCFSSGIAAIDAIIKGGLRPGDHVVATSDLYGGTFRLFEEVFGPYGVEFTFVDMTDLAAVEEAIRPETKLLWLETPTNPLLRVLDIARLSELAREQAGERTDGGETAGGLSDGLAGDKAAGRQITVACDNTFASPYLQNPLALGADLVMHSATKYIGGHSDLIMGAVCTNSDDWAEKLRFQIKSAGAAPGPMDCFLALRGTKTLHLRMERHCENARRVAEMLNRHEAVDTVNYPGLPDDPGHEVAVKQMKDFGGMISFTLKDDRMDAAIEVLSATRIFSLAESLGGVESLIEHPPSMTHATIPARERYNIGMKDSLIRLSVGVEDGDDLVEDLEQALN